MEKITYEKPTVEGLEFAAEAGIAVSARTPTEMVSEGESYDDTAFN